VMSSAVQSVFDRWRRAASAAAAAGGGGVEVDEIDQEFGADAADEALWMPVRVRSGA